MLSFVVGEKKTIALSDTVGIKMINEFSFQNLEQSTVFRCVHYFDTKKGMSLLNPESGSRTSVC